MIVHTESRWGSLEEGKPILTEKMAVCQLEDGNKSGAISGRMTTTTAIHMLHNVPAPVRAIRETVRRSAKGTRETGPCNAIARTEPSLRSFTSFTYFQRPKLFLLFATHTHTHTHPLTRSGTQNALQTLEPQNSIISKTYKSGSCLCSSLLNLAVDLIDPQTRLSICNPNVLQTLKSKNPTISKPTNLSTYFLLFTSPNFVYRSRNPTVSISLSTWNPNVL